MTYRKEIADVCAESRVATSLAAVRTAQSDLTF